MTSTISDSNLEQKTVDYLIKVPHGFTFRPDDLREKGYKVLQKACEGFKIRLRLDKELDSETLSTLSGAGCVVYQRVN